MHFYRALCCCLLSGVLIASESEATGPRLLCIGNYMMGHPSGMLAPMFTGGAQRLYLAKDCHADLVDNHQPWLVDWITGAGTVAASSWRDNKNISKIAPQFEGKPFDIVVLQVKLHWKGPADAIPADLAEGLAGFKTAIDAAGARHVLYIHPDGSNTSVKRGRDGGPKSEEDYAREIDEIHPRTLNIARSSGFQVAPTYLAFDALRRSHPQLDIHAPRAPSDGHLSSGDSYLVACTIFAALHDERPDFGSVAACLEKENEAIRKKNRKATAKGEPALPETVIDPDTAAAIQDAAWAAVERFRQDLATVAGD